MLLTAEHTPLAPAAFVAQHARVFAVFDRNTQDSGNVSYGVQVGAQRWFVKTAGSPADSRAFLRHDARVALLRNAVRVARALADPALPVLRNVIESAEGPLLVYDWLEGELLRTPGACVSDPNSALARFLRLSRAERRAALEAVFRVHVKLAERGYVASDFYDGCLLYDFVKRALFVIDLDNYRDAPFTNEMGRMFGSTRFMAPEEHALGARIDQRTTVFTLGRTVQQFLAAGGEASQGVAELIARACQTEPAQRFGSVLEFYGAWAVVSRAESP